MPSVLIRYRLRAAELERHLALLRAVHDELAERRPPGMRWASYALDDGVSFVDVVTVDTPGSFSRLRSWAAYRSTLDDRCEAPPTLTELHPVAEYASPVPVG